MCTNMCREINSLKKNFNFPMRHARDIIECKSNTFTLIIAVRGFD